MDVSDRRMQVQLTPEAKIATDFFFIGAIFAVVGFVSALGLPQRAARFPCAGRKNRILSHKNGLKWRGCPF